MASEISQEDAYSYAPAITSITGYPDGVQTGIDYSPTTGYLKQCAVIAFTYLYVIDGPASRVVQIPLTGNRVLTCARSFANAPVFTLHEPTNEVVTWDVVKQRLYLHPHKDVLLEQISYDGLPVMVNERITVHPTDRMTEFRWQEIP